MTVHQVRFDILLCVHYTMKTTCNFHPLFLFELYYTHLIKKKRKRTRRRPGNLEMAKFLSRRAYTFVRIYIPI